MLLELSLWCCVITLKNVFQYAQDLFCFSFLGSLILEKILFNSISNSADGDDPKLLWGYTQVQRLTAWSLIGCLPTWMCWLMFGGLCSLCRRRQLTWAFTGSSASCSMIAVPKVAPGLPEWLVDTCQGQNEHIACMPVLSSPPILPAFILHAFLESWSVYPVIFRPFCSVAAKVRVA